jgi:ATP-dependent Clp protease ATP-binding subunit ClpA
VIEVFSDQAYNLILLAEDEARMLGQAMVEPEHLLLALARRGNVESLLERRDISASDIHAAIVRADGLGVELVLGRVPRSASTDAALARAIGAAAERGILGPSSEHVLLGLADDPAASAVLREVGIEDPVALVNEIYLPNRSPLPTEQVQRYAARLAIMHEPPQPGPIAPGSSASPPKRTPRS